MTGGERNGIRLFLSPDRQLVDKESDCNRCKSSRGHVTPFNVLRMDVNAN